ncbi:MAG: hypothetical protein K8W52_03460 [Deltaproteobacteria bacterium]|nr:hypothetical protein [Deltaproteobacteria bacterium]
MRVVVDTPADWLHQRVPGAGFAFANPARTVVVEVGALVPAPLDGPAFVRAVVTDAVGEVRVMASATERSACGWAYDWIECVILGEDGEVREIRLVAIYQFLARVAVIRVAGRDAAALRAERDAIERLLASARPDWRDERVAAIAELWADA